MFPTVNILLAVIASAVAESFNDNLGQVVFSHVLFRHGNRMPLGFYPNDPYKESSNWPFKVAQLTDIGKTQEYELGRWLRLRYDSLLSDVYDPEEIYVQSTDVDRTLMSAECVMGGLYHSNRTALSWEPVPIHTIPTPSDCMLGATSTCLCPAYDNEMKRVHSLPEVQALGSKFLDMYDYVSNHTSSQVRDFGGAVSIYDVLSIEEEYNKTIPEWAHAIYPEPIREAALYSFVLPTWTTLLQKFKIGPLLKEMVSHFQAKRNASLTPDRKVWFYSAHDATISAFLNTLKVFDMRFPPYSACAILELRKIKEEYFVTLLYRNSTVSEPQFLPIKTCSTVCPLDQFIRLVHPLLPDDWAQECQLSVEMANRYSWPAVIAASVLIASLITISLVVCFKKRSSRNYLTMPTPYIGGGSVKNNPYL